MRLTQRDTKLVKDIALSHVLSRDQVITLGYFSSVTRTNTRLRQLRTLGLVKSLETPFHGQTLYAAGPKAILLVGERIAPILSGRLGSPRFIQHALATTNVRIELQNQGSSIWRFEQQVRSLFRFGGRDHEIRPDGVALTHSGILALEVDLGHVDPSKFKQKLLAYDAFVASGECRRIWNTPTFSLLAVTTGSLRARRPRELAPSSLSFEFACQSADQFGVAFPGSWS